MYPLLLSLLMMLFAGPAASGSTVPLPVPADLADGRYGFHFATCEGVVGDCDGFSVKHGAGHTASFHHGHWPARDMEPGPAWVTFTVGDGQVRRLELAVGDCVDRLPRGARDLGLVTGPNAADWLLDLVRNRRVDDDVREQALHLLAVLAGAKVIEPVKDIIGDRDEDLEFRESAVFALSQLEGEQALDALLGIGRGHKEPRLQRAAIFALSQYEDERAVALYEEILREK